VKPSWFQGIKRRYWLAYWLIALEGAAFWMIAQRESDVSFHDVVMAFISGAVFSGAIVLVDLVLIKTRIESVPFAKK
jgi:hypothetical protein